MKNKLKFLLLILIIASGAYLSHHYQLTSKITPQSFKLTIESYGRAGPIVYMLSYILTSLILFPASLLSTSAGFIWGPYFGTFYTVIGASLSAIVPFFLARTLGRGSVQSKLPENGKICDMFISQNGFFSVLIMRLIPLFPWDLTNYGCGFCGIKTRDYLLATFVGIIPGSFAFNLAGANLGNSPDPWQIALFSSIFLALSLMGFIYKFFYLPRKRAAAFDFDIGIIGGGSAGLSACVGATGLGARTLLIDRAKDNQFGGDCLKTGCVPSKSLIRSAEVNALINNSGQFGLPAVRAEKVDFSKVAARIREIQKSIGRNDVRERFESLGASVVQGDAKFIDNHKVDVGGKVYSADKWIIATGSAPFVPPIPGLDKVKFMTSDNIFDLNELPETLLVVGGGPIGVELAQAFLQLGSKVVILDMADQILAIEDPEVAAPVISALVSKGVKIYNRIEGLEFKSESETIIASFKLVEEQISVRASHLLVATGRKPVISSLALENAGVKIEKGAIIVDKHLKTSQDNIYACGDSNGKLMFTHVAAAEAAVAVANALLRIPRRIDYDKVPWCTFTSPEVASIGLNQKFAKQRKIDYEILQVEFADVDRAETESETEGFARVLIDAKGRLLGAQIVGHNAGELIHMLIPFVVARKKITDAAKEIVIYPCRADYVKKLQSEYLKKKFFNPTWRNRLKKIFGFRGPIKNES